LTSGQFENPSITSFSPSELIYLVNPSFCLRNLGKNPFAPFNPLKRKKYLENPLFRFILSLGFMCNFIQKYIEITQYPDLSKVLSYARFYKEIT